MTGGSPASRGGVRLTGTISAFLMYFRVCELDPEQPRPSGSSACSTPKAQTHWVAAIEGFTTTFDILQTYEPTSGPIGFRVPYMLEGFPAADHFDTYYDEFSSW